MSNLSLFPTATVAATVTKVEATEIARRLYADDANAFSAVSNTAARESFCKRCASLAISAMVHGDDSRLRRLKAKAVELPEYRKTKSGEITGNLGKLLTAYGEAASIGFMLRDMMKNSGTDVTKVDIWDLSIIESSPSFGALIAPPKARIKETSTSTSTSTTTAPSTSTSTTTAPSTSTSTTTAPSTSTSTLPEKHWSELTGKIGDADDGLLEVEANTAQDKANAAAAAAAAELVRNAVLAAERLRATGKSTAEKIAAFCDLATQLGIKLTASQLKALDVIEAKTKAVA